MCETYRRHMTTWKQMMTKDYDLIFCFTHLDSPTLKLEFEYLLEFCSTQILASGLPLPPNGIWVNQNSTLFRILDSDLPPPTWSLVNWNILHYSNFGFWITFPKPEFSELNWNADTKYWFPNAWFLVHRHGDIPFLSQKYIAIAFLCIMEWSSICSVSHVIHTHITSQFQMEDSG